MLCFIGPNATCSKSSAKVQLPEILSPMVLAVRKQFLRLVLFGIYKTKSLQWGKSLFAESSVFVTLWKPIFLNFFVLALFVYNPWVNFLSRLSLWCNYCSFNLCKLCFCQTRHQKLILSGSSSIAMALTKTIFSSSCAFARHNFNMQYSYVEEEVSSELQKLHGFSATASTFSLFVCVDYKNLQLSDSFCLFQHQQKWCCEIGMCWFNQVFSLQVFNNLPHGFFWKPGQ